MELHTLGVDGGYTQRDVTELARVLTGLGSIDQRRAARIRCSGRGDAHDVGAKTVLGQRLPAGGGMEEGEDDDPDPSPAIPSTARHIATKLCQRLVSDAPPHALVDAGRGAVPRDATATSARPSAPWSRARVLRSRRVTARR